MEVRPASLSPGLSPRGRRAESRVRPTSHRSAACRPPQGTHPGNQTLKKEDVHIWCNLGEEKIEFALGNKEFCFWQGKKASRKYFDFISDVWARGIYLSLTLGTAKFKHLHIFLAVTNF